MKQILYSDWLPSGQDGPILHLSCIAPQRACPQGSPTTKSYLFGHLGIKYFIDQASSVKMAGDWGGGRGDLARKSMMEGKEGRLELSLGEKRFPSPASSGSSRA